MVQNKTYLAIDLKSFYASVECVERGLDAMKTNLVVADKERTSKTICLAVSPSLKRYGIPGRARLFEVIEKVNTANIERQKSAPNKKFTGASADSDELNKHPELSIDFITAPPQMAKYIEISSKIYEIYLKYVAPEDIHVYSIDEVFIDVTGYLKSRKTTARRFAMMIITDVLKSTGITATAGIGTNLYLAKVAMDIVAKHIPPDKNGVRIAELDEMSYRQKLWEHRPLTSFWRVGRGYAKKLEAQKLYTMGDIARCSIGKATDYYNEELLYRMFGVNAELLIDHAWGWEPCTIADIKAYKPDDESIGSAQVLHCPYTFEKAAIVVREMADALSLELVEKKLVTNQIILVIGYDIENLKDPDRRKKYRGAVTYDHYGRAVPKHANGAEKLDRYTSSSKIITNAAEILFKRIADPALLIRRISITANHVVPEHSAACEKNYKQLDLFTDPKEESAREEEEKTEREREKNLQKAMLDIKKKFGKNAILKGTDLQDGATAIERNNQIGGHKA